MPDNAGSVYHTQNGGKSWHPATILKRSLFAFHTFFADNQNGWFVTNAELWGTGDGGVTWGPKFTVDYAEFGIVRDIFFVNKNTGWLVTSGGYVLKCASF